MTTNQRQALPRSDSSNPDQLPTVVRGVTAVFSRFAHTLDLHLRDDPSSQPVNPNSLNPDSEDLGFRTHTIERRAQHRPNPENEGGAGRPSTSDWMHVQVAAELDEEEETSDTHGIPVLVDFRSVLPGRSFASISSSLRPGGLTIAGVQRAFRPAGAEEANSGGKVQVKASSSSSSTANTTSATSSGAGASTATVSTEGAGRSPAPLSHDTRSLELLPFVWQPLQQAAFPFLVEAGVIATTLVVTLSASAVAAIQPGRVASSLASKLRGGLLELRERQQQDVERVQKLLPVGLLLRGKWRRPGRRLLDCQLWGQRLLARIAHPAPFDLFPSVGARTLRGPLGHRSGVETEKEDSRTGAEASSGTATGAGATSSSCKITPLQAADAAQSAEGSTPKGFVCAGAQEPPPGFTAPPESTQQLAKRIASSAEVSWSGFIRPVDKVWEISSRFGPRWGRNHNGVDLAAPTGEPVLAADEGRVTYAGWEPTGFGYLIEITHDDGWRTLYGHNSKLYAWTGKRVVRGECIALVGETGKATGPHLHWEIRKKDGFPVDPAKYIPL